MLAAPRDKELPLPPTRRSVPVGALDADPVFVSFAIRHYVDTPEDRATIGMDAGLAKLNEAFAASGADSPRTRAS